jgi:sialate O-acetylesterase
MNADAAGGPGAAERTVALVKQWRQLWGEDFYFINCTRMRYTTGQPPLIPMMVDNAQNDSIRDSQKLFADDKHNDFVECMDLGNWYSHYLEKEEAGRRLGLCALNLAYGEKTIYSGPRMAEIKIEGNKATVRFGLVGDSISYQPSIDGISGIYLRDKSGKTAWAQVNVTGKDTIECSSPDLSSLDTVAYGEYVNPHETLFNSAGLPASPFVLNPYTGYPPASPYDIASFLDGQKAVRQLTNGVIKGGTIDMAHVRRTGYVFKITGQEPLDLALKPIPGASTPNIGDSTATVPMLAYIPAEWQGYEVVTGDKWGWDGHTGIAICTGLKAKGGKVLEATETPKNGAKFITFNAPVDGTWIIVAEKGKAADFAKVNRY